MKLPQMHSGLCFLCEGIGETMFHNMHGDGKSYCYECLSKAIEYYSFHLDINKGEDL